MSQFQTEFELRVAAPRRPRLPRDLGANPRGSSGRGRAFSRAIWADWGGKDFEDVMAAVDAAVAEGAADPDRLGVGGWSYGGILTDWTIYQTNRFKAAIAGAGIANALAGYGTDHYQYEYEAELGPALEERRRAGLKLSKPFLEVDKIKTPTLFLCGEVDWNVPLINSEQMYQALRRLGVPTELVVYPGESHGIDVPSYQKDRLRALPRLVRPVSEAGAAAARHVRRREATSLLGKTRSSRPRLPRTTEEDPRGEARVGHRRLRRRPRQRRQHALAGPPSLVSRPLPRRHRRSSPAASRAIPTTCASCASAGTATSSVREFDKAHRRPREGRELIRPGKKMPPSAGAGDPGVTPGARRQHALLTTSTTTSASPTT